MTPGHDVENRPKSQLVIMEDIEHFETHNLGRLEIMARTALRALLPAWAGRREQ
jgi:hypothetical protein